jgi:DNA-binding Lrp family transcriptional regulator
MVSKPGDDDGPVADLPSLDELDRSVVAVLCEDGRISIRALAARLHISRASAYQRVQRLEEAGVITGYTARVDPRRYGYGLSAYVHLKIAQPAWKPLRDRLMTIPEVEHAALVSGETDIVLLIRTRDTTALRELVLSRILSMSEVLSTQTVLIFDDLARVATGAAAPSPATPRSRR